MQVIQLTKSGFQFYCPITGEKAFHDDGEPNAKSVRGIWVDAEPSEPCYLTSELENAWNDYKIGREACEEFCNPCEFLKSVDKEGWIAFEITNTESGYGPVTTTTWAALDLN